MRVLEAPFEARLLERRRLCRFAWPIRHDASRRAAEAELQIEAGLIGRSLAIVAGLFAVSPILFRETREQFGHKRRGGQKNSPSEGSSWGCGVVAYVDRGRGPRRLTTSKTTGSSGERFALL
jgi:hypothetical protein